LMLRPTGFNTLATELWTRTEVEAFGSAAPYALAMILLASIPAWLMGRWLARAPEGRSSEATEHDSPVHEDHTSYIGSAR
jgi:iron(III) transport system permease protein